MASYKIRTAGNCSAVFFTIRSPFNIRIGRRNRCRHGCCRRNYSLLQQRKLVSDAEGRCSDCRSWRAILHRHDDYAAAIRKSGPEIKNRCMQVAVNRQNHASIRKFGPEIKNRCTQVAVNRENLTSIRKSGLEIKNRCTHEGINRQNPASIPKFGPEIKNRCRKWLIFSTPPSTRSITR